MPLDVDPSQGAQSGASSLILGSNGQTPGSYYSPYANYNQLLGGYSAGSTSAMNQMAPQMNAALQGQFRQMQLNQANQLAGIAGGTQQGAGELAVQRQVANAQAAQQAQANMVRGGNNAGMAFRNAAVNSANVGLGGAGQSQQAALSDQQAAQGQLSGVLGQARGQDQSFAQGNAQLQQQQYANNNQANLGYLNGLGQMDQGQLAAQTSAYGAGQQNKGLLGSLMGAAGTAATMFSDERLKTDVRDGGSDIDDMLDKLVAKTYRYKNAKHGVGERPGIIAQDLEKSRLGASTVVELPEGKAVDVNRALSAALASAARLNERMRKAGI